MARIKGNVTPLLTFKNGAASAFDFGSDVVSVEFADGAGNAITMSDFANGVSPVQMSVTFVLDFASTASYEYMWNNSGVTGVTYTFQPSNGSASQTNPKFSGTCTMPAKPRFAIAAGDATSVQTYDVVFQLDTFTKAIV